MWAITTAKKLKITKDEVSLLLYVDYGASLFSSRIEAILGINIMFNQMKRMDFNMHIGGGDKTFKTEAVVSPSKSKTSEWSRKEKVNDNPSAKEKKYRIMLLKRFR